MEKLTAGMDEHDCLMKVGNILGQTVLNMGTLTKDQLEELIAGWK